MEAKNCIVYDLAADALLPPRKRLLAGLKRQSYCVNDPAPSPSTSHVVDAKYDTHIHSFLRTKLNNPNLTNDDIVETSRYAAMEAVKVAEAARANAEIKSAKAARAMAAAKSALDLVSILLEEAADREKSVRKSKTKKHVMVESLYNKNKGNTNPTTDEELALELHHAINSSTRPFKCSSSGSDAKNQKHKKMKSSAPSSKSIIQFAAPHVDEDGLYRSTRNSTSKLEVNAEAPVKEIDMVTVGFNATKSNAENEANLLDPERANST